MKYRTFILIRNCVGAGLVVLAGFGLVKGCTSATQRTVLSTPAPVEHNPAPKSPTHSDPARSVRRATAAPGHGRSLATSTPDAAARKPLSSLDLKVIELSKSALTNGSSDGAGRKWRVKQDRMVIELRSDTAKGSTNWNRIKIDLDRDKNWDEAWDLKPGKPIKRRIAPADDENYTVTYDLRGDTWVKREK